jgi:hypothetical protein
MKSMRKKKDAPEPELTADELRALWDDLGKQVACIHCGAYHPWPATACRRIQKIVFFPPQSNGTSPVAEVVYFGEWDESASIYLHDLPERPEEDDPDSMV